MSFNYAALGLLIGSTMSSSNSLLWTLSVFAAGVYARHKLDIGHHVDNAERFIQEKIEEIKKETVSKEKEVEK